VLKKEAAPLGPFFDRWLAGDNGAFFHFHRRWAGNLANSLHRELVKKPV